MCVWLRLWVNVYGKSDSARINATGLQFKIDCQTTSVKEAELRYQSFNGGWKRDGIRECKFDIKPLECQVLGAKCRKNV